MNLSGWIPGTPGNFACSYEWLGILSVALLSESLARISKRAYTDQYENASRSGKECAIALVN